MRRPNLATAPLTLLAAILACTPIACSGTGTQTAASETAATGETGDTSETATGSETAGPTGEPTDGTGDPTNGTGDTADTTDTTGPTTGPTTAGETEATQGETSETTTDGDPDPLAGLVLEEAFDDPAHGWARVERWRMVDTEMPPEDYFPGPRSHLLEPHLTYFDNDPVPDRRVFLVYYAPKWAENSRTPVLLAHGATDSPDRAFANPGMLGDYGCGQQSCPATGLMQDLVDRDVPVFAVMHPHGQGNNLHWAEQIHQAIRIIRARTANEQVDLIGWSKGAFAARLYTTDVREPWGTPYAQDVRKLILIGGPNKGLDYIYRWGAATAPQIFPDYGGMLNSPSPHEELLLFGQWQDRSEHSILKTAMGDFYVGQRQMLARLDDSFPLTGTANFGNGEFAVVDSDSTYYGESMQHQGTTTRGKGIAFAIDQGSLIADMLQSPVPASVETYLLCSEIDPGDMSQMMLGIPNEIGGPSDGVVFVDSCAHTVGIGQAVATEVLSSINHLQMGWVAPAVDTIDGWLQ